MERFECTACGSTELYEKDGYVICPYCGSKFRKSRENGFSSESSIELDNDIKKLIEKIELEPHNAKRYAELILSIDPHNTYAAHVLSQQKTDNSGCYVATAVYGSYDCPEVWTLRRFRDNILAKSFLGRAFIRTYYAASPTLVKHFGHTAWFKTIFKATLDKFVAGLQAKGIKNTPYQDRHW